MADAATIQHSTAVGQFVSLLFDTFQNCGVRYCVLHGWDELPEHVGTDLDLVIDPEDVSKLAAVFAAMADAGYRWIQCRHYAGCSYRFDFAWFEGKQFHVVGVDCISEYRYAGLILRSGQQLLVGKRLFRGFWIASSQNAFAYLLMKKCLKRQLSSEQANLLHRMSDQLGLAQATQVASDLFGPEMGSAVVRAIDEKRLGGMLDNLRSIMEKRLRRQSPGMRLRYQATEKLRQVKRWFFPTGVVVVALGPDGVGKSTLLARISANLEPAFRSTQLFHYRATFGTQSHSPVVAPHAKAPRGYLMSVARLLLWYAQFWVSYLFIVRPRLERSCFVAFDRYFHDVLVDRRRYRYAGPEWLPRFLLKLLPSRNVLLLLLDADENAIHARKQEVPIAELRALREGYKHLGQVFSSSATIRTDVALEDSTAAATDAVYRYMLRRIGQRHPQWVQPQTALGGD